MKNSNFFFLADEFPLLLNIGKLAEFNLFIDPNTTLYKCRQFGEKVLELVYEEHYLEFPDVNNFHNNLIKIKYENIIPERVLDLLFTIKNKGNIAVHDGVGSEQDAKSSLINIFKVAKWLYEVYARNPIDVSEIKYHLPENSNQADIISKLEQDFSALETKFNQLLAEREIKEQTKEEKLVILKRSEKVASRIEWKEADTRELIDQQLRAAGWIVDTLNINNKSKNTLPEKGKNMAIAEWPVHGKYADYALFVGTELYGIVEAKKYASDISSDLTQAKIYSELAEAKNEGILLGKWENYHVPFVFSTNGRPFLEQIKTKSGIWFLDVREKRNRSRALQGWFSPQGLKDLFAQNPTEAIAKLQNSDLAYLTGKNSLELRDYQIKAIKAIEDFLATEPEKRKALLAMATGTGKTRTILGLCYRLIKANRFKRILFLVDRTLLAKQTFDTFKDTKVEDFNSFLETYHVSELKNVVPDYESRLHFATVQGMVKRLFYNSDENDILPVDTYDCIIVDEAHRGYLQDKELDSEELNFKDQRDYVSKYRMVLDYFDAYGIALTATPALHTTEIFGKPVYSYSYREAVIDGYLIDHDPPYIIKTKLSEEGITWKKGDKPKIYDKEINEVVELDELEDELNIDISGFNKSVITPSFNKTVIQQLVKELDPESDEKTLIFAATDAHADDVVKILEEEFEAIGVDVPFDSILKITGKSYNPQELVRRFKNEKYPSIVVTVDLLSTGVDVPKICNIVFLRRIKSRILYEQMLGRATRKCDEINKTSFKIFDAVRVYETLEDYTSMKPVAPSPSTSFIQLIDELDVIENEARYQKQIEQIIAKYQRKKKYIETHEEEKFTYHAKGIAPNDFVEHLKGMTASNFKEELKGLKTVWQYLDELKPEGNMQFFSDHEDSFVNLERGYGKGQKPEDYLESLKQFIEENRNKILALQIICTRPKELDRKSLKELKLILDQNGFNTRSLNAAWKETRNEDIAADIITYIRTLAIGSSLVSHETRIKSAVDKIRTLKNWNKVQEKWIDRFEKQLLQEEVIQLEDLNTDPFDEVGGFDKLDKVFEFELKELLEQLNENLYREIG